MDNSELWNKILEKSKEDYSSLIYDSWFAENKLYKIENGIAIIIVPYAYCKLWITNNYKDYLINAFNEFNNEQINDINLVLEEEIEETENNQEEKKIVNNINNDNYNSNDENNDIPFDSHLNKKYTFDSFIVGNCNKLAHTAALAVAEKPGELYNPLFIYGNSGLGKTHLMHAIGNYITEHSNKRVLYVSSYDFQREYTKIASKNDNIEYIDFFRKKYSDIDVLMIDDIQQLEHAPSTRNEFFQTFNTLHDENKQIIISSDRSPDDLKLFEERLKTRFTWGLTVDLYPPDYETKLAIYKKKIQNENLNKEIPEEVIEYMAANIGTNMRAIEGSINRLLAYATMMGEKITLELTTEALKNEITPGFSEKTDVSKIERIVADYYNITIEDLKSKKRNSNIAFPRQIAMYLIRKLTDESFPKIGQEFGGKDHTTVIHACEKIQNDIKNNENLKKTIEKLENDIKS